MYSPLQPHKAALSPMWMYHEVQDLDSYHSVNQIVKRKDRLHYKPTYFHIRVLLWCMRYDYLLYMK